MRRMMINKSVMLSILGGLLLLFSCSVHEFPEIPEFIKYHLRLNYETNMTEWEHLYCNNQVIEQGYGDTYDNKREYGKIRYVIRTYPISASRRSSMDYTQEFVITKNISEGYNHEVTLDLIPGDYDVMVWSDLIQTTGDAYFYNPANFAKITLSGDYEGNNDYRDAFRGFNTLSISTDYIKLKPDTLDISMERPMAKFEFVTNDVEEFIIKEATRVTLKASGNIATLNDDTPTRAIDIEDYKVVFYYVGFVPDVYSMNTDKPMDCTTGVMFESTLKKLSESTATMGFDYVFVNGKKSAVTIQIGVYDNEGEQLSLTKPIEVPLKRNYHTIMTGMFLTSKTFGGIIINPDFDGDHNLIFP